jgi:hypothetical protein
MMESEIRDTSGMTHLAEAVSELRARMSRLEEHLDLVPAGSTGSTQTSEPIVTDTPVDAPIKAPADSIVPSLGYAILMIAGAFLLRAFTEARILDATPGILLGLGYSVGLLWPTRRAAITGHRSRATLFGLAYVLVAFPLVWETSTRLGLLPPPGAAGGVTLMTVLGLALALRHHLGGLAWCILLAALATMSGLYWTTGAHTLFAGLVLALGATTVWLGYLRDWQGPQWLTSSMANALVLLTIALGDQAAGTALETAPPVSAAVITLALGLVVVYLGSFSLRTMYQRHEAGVFEVAQSLGCLLVGYLGAVHLLHSGGGGTAALGWVTLAAAAVGYGTAFTFVRRQQGRGLTFFYHAWLGLLLTFLGTALVVPAGGLPYLWGGLAVTVAIAGGRLDRWTLRLHCAAYLIAATAMTGLPATVFDSFTAPSAQDWRGLARPGITAWIMAATCYGLLVATHRRCELSPWRRLPRFLIALIVLAGAGGLLVTALASWSIRLVPGSEEAVVAAVRTAVLAITTMALAFTHRRRSIVELSWFVNPLLILGGLKLLLEDMRRGTPVSLFFGFAVFGIALIIASRLRRTNEPASAHIQPGQDGEHPDTALRKNHGA